MDGLNQDSAPGLILVKTALDNLYAEEMLQNTRMGKFEATDPMVFTQGSATNAAVNSSVLGGGGYFEDTVDDFATTKDAVVTAAALKTTRISLFKKNLPIPRTFLADQQQDAVAKAVRQQTKTWLASRDRNAFSVYGNGFSTQLTIDNVALFSNSHINQNGDTVDNLETGVLTDSNLNILVNSLRTQIAQTGVILGYEPDFLLTPSILDQTGRTVAKSVLKAGTGNNDLNYFSEMYPGMQVGFSPFLDSFSTTAYYIGSKGHGVMRWERESFFTRLVDWETDDGDRYKYKMRAREAVDSIEYSGLAASNGTT
jgi:hypothetical protein